MTNQRRPNNGDIRDYDTHGCLRHRLSGLLGRRLAYVPNHLGLESIHGRSSKASQLVLVVRPMRLFFARYDFRIGAYWDRECGVLYICPLPMLGIKIRLRSHRGRFWAWRNRRAWSRQMKAIRQRAEANDYENVYDWLHDTAWSIKYDLEERGVRDVELEEVTKLLLEENGDSEKVLQGFLED